METFSALLAFCAGNSPVTGEFPSQRPVTQSFKAFFDLCLNKRLSKQSRDWWFETPMCSLWRHCNEQKRVLVFQEQGSQLHAPIHGDIIYYVLPQIISPNTGITSFLFQMHHQSLLKPRDDLPICWEIFNRRCENRIIFFSANDFTLTDMGKSLNHDVVMTWKRFLHYWPFVRGIHYLSIYSPHNGQWCGSPVLYLMLSRTNCGYGTNCRVANGF